MKNAPYYALSFPFILLILFTLLVTKNKVDNRVISEKLQCMTYDYWEEIYPVVARIPTIEDMEKFGGQYLKLKESNDELIILLRK